MKVMLGALALAMLAVAPAAAKDATCFTYDDGEYPCQFKALDKDGSFQISAEGKPTFILTMDSPGTAFGSAQYCGDGHSTNLPGTYIRSGTTRPVGKTAIPIRKFVRGNECIQISGERRDAGLR